MVDLDSVADPLDRTTLPKHLGAHPIRIETGGLLVTGNALGPHEGQIVVRGDSKAAVETERKVRPVVPADPAGDDGADRGVLIQNPATDAEDTCIFSAAGLGRRGLDVKNTEVPGTGSTDDPDTADDAHQPTVVDADPAAVEDAVSVGEVEFESAGAFLEERPFLRVEQGESGEVEPHVIGLDLGEIRVDRDIERDVRGDQILQVEPDLLLLAVQSGGFGTPGLNPSLTGQGVWRNVEPLAGGSDVAKLDRLRLRRFEQPRETPGRRDLGIDVPLLVAGDRPADNQTHDDSPGGIRLKAERAERDAHLSEPSIIGAHRRHVPERVPVNVPSARPLVVVFHRGVPAQPGRGGEKRKRVLFVVESVDHDSEPVAAGVTRVPFHRVALDPAGLAVEKASGDIQVLVVVSDEKLRRL